MLRCPEPHEENVLVMSTGEMLGRMVRSGIVGCPVCHREYPIVKGVVHFSGGEGTPLRDKNTQSLRGVPSPPSSLPPLAVLLGSAARHAVGLAGLMGGIHFVGVNAPPGVEELPVLSLLACDTMVPLRHAMARGVVVGPEPGAWLAEAARILLRGRRLVVEREDAAAPPGVTPLAVGQGLFVGQRG